MHATAATAPDARLRPDRKLVIVVLSMSRTVVGASSGYDAHVVLTGTRLKLAVNRADLGGAEERHRLSHLFNAASSPSVVSLCALRLRN